MKKVLAILMAIVSVLTLAVWNTAAANNTDRIHFMSTGNSDAILLESDGHFALVDAGEDTDNPRGFADLELEGFEQRVLAYLKANAADESGKVYLDFVLGTHAHSDHIGGFDTILADPDVTAGRAYLKRYDSSKISQYEIDNWDNQEVYDQMIAALAAKNIPVISEMDDTPFFLGNFRVTLFNTDDPPQEEKVGENDQSLGVLVEKNGTRIFLAGDMDDYTGDETRLAPQIGKVDLLKVGHHGTEGSSTEGFLRTLSPRICVFTAYRKAYNQTTRRNLMRICHPEMYFTTEENGVLATIGDNGEITCQGQLHPDAGTPTAAQRIEHFFIVCGRALIRIFNLIQWRWTALSRRP
ncbi:MAG: MBL fold metallo-hydrolase [Clostridia bacterium]|nr:MBL fold metallo-hydrolase [Clostridia bacterium]